MDVQQINSRIYDLWSNYSEQHNNLAPEFIKAIGNNSLLFVGLNPAFNQKWIGQILKENHHSEITPSTFLSWSTVEDKESYINRINNIERNEKANLYRYFKKFDQIARNLQLEWSHIDLFFYRETNQNKLKEKILDGGSLNEFGLRQLEVSGELILLSNPKVIIFSNALSSALFRDNYKKIGFTSLDFDHQKGFHYLGFGEKKVPTFFSGMLTGQRALDLGSLERLEWHIKKAVEDEAY